MIVKNDQIYTEENVIRFLEDGHTLCLMLGYYPTLSEDYRPSGHVVVIFGYVYVDGVCKFLVRDPSPMSTGSTQVVSYAYIVNRASTQEGANAAIYVWESTLVCATTYSSETIPNYFDQDDS